MAGHLDVSLFAIRPRFTELRAMGRIERTSERRPSGNGHPQWVYRLTRKEG